MKFDENTDDAGFGRMLDIGGIATIVVVAVTGILYIPTWFNDSKAEVLAEITRLEAIADDERHIRDEHAETSGRLEAAERRLAEAIDRVPLTIDESTFLAEIVGHAEEHGIALGDYETGRVVSHETHEELDVVIEGRCSHAALCRMLGSLANSPRAGRVTKLTVERTAPETDRLSFRLVWRLYSQEADVSKPADVAQRTTRTIH